MYVPFFRCESFPCISCRADWFPCASFPFHSPCTPLVFISVPFMSFSVPLCFPFVPHYFPVMSTSCFLPSFPCTSLHFPLCSPVFPAKNTFFQCFRKEDVQTHRVFPDFRQKEAGNPNQQRAWDPCFATPAPQKLRLAHASDVGRGGGGGVCGGGLSSILSWCPDYAEQCRRILTHSHMS